MPTKPQTENNALWKTRYHATTIWSATLARQVPDRGLIESSASGVAQLYAWDVPAGNIRQLTWRKEGAARGMLSPNGRFVYYLRDEGGSERGHLVCIPWEGGEEQDLTPDMASYSSLYHNSVSDDGSMLAFLPTETKGFPLYCLALSPDGAVGAPREIYRSPKFVDDAILSSHAELVVVATTEYAPARQYSLLVFDTANGKRIAELSDLPGGSIRAIDFSPLPGDLRLLCTTNRSGYNRPLLWDLKSGERRDISLAELNGEIELLNWLPDGQRILFSLTTRAVQHLYIYDLNTDTLTRLQHPAGTYFDVHSQDGGQILALWSDSTHPTQLIVVDGATGTLQKTLLSIGEAPPTRRMHSVCFHSGDGTEIQGWLGLPEGPGPFPTILHTHGGPLVATREEFDPEAQSWLDHGYAFLTINYRGSTTFGRAFQEQIWGNLGFWEVEDMVAAREWLVHEGIAQPDAILVTGASYGGYLTLMALGKQPALWAGGMAVVAPADFIDEFYQGTDWTRGYLTAMMGGTPQEKYAQYVASSPITYAQDVQVPLLVIQGKNDMRSPAHQMELYAEKMQSLGKPFEIHWFDAGHGSAQLDWFIDTQARLLDFAYRILSQRPGSEK